MQGRSGLALAVIVVVAIAALAVWVFSSRSAPASSPAATGRAAPLTTSPPSAPPAGVPAPPGCNSPTDGTTAALEAAPAGLQWSVGSGSVVPSSPGGGPSVVEGTVARCFGHDAAGALFAAIRIPGALGSANAVDWRQLADAGLVPGPGKDAVVSFAQQAFASIGSSAGGQAPAAVAGFNFVSYTPAQAVVTLAFRAPGGGFYSSDTVVVWSGTDWQVQPNPGGQLGTAPAQVPSLVGFVPLEQP